MTRTAVGIDLGTTNSLIAAFRNGKAEVLAAPEDGSRLCPSVVQSAADGSVVVGEAASVGRLGRAHETVYSIKRFMGRSFADAARHVDDLGYKLFEGKDGLPRVRLGDRLMTAPEVSSLILKELVRRGEAALGARPTHAVITVPAYFDDAARQATRDAATLAGLETLRIINEPTAACVAYGLGKDMDGIFAVYDFGGGTFDISILKVTDGVFRTLATAGDVRLGGDDVDHALAVRLLARAEAASGRSIERTPKALEAARSAAEAAKIALSTSDFADAALHLGEEGVRYEETTTRRELEEIAAPFVDRTLKLAAKAMKDAGVSATDLTALVLVGGSTRMPLVRRRTEQFFGRPGRLDLDPDETVALGAAVQSAVITGANRSLLLLDVLPLSLGIETMGGAVAKILPRNTTIPTAVRQEFTTHIDDQRAVLIHVLQGERELAADCRSLARFSLKGIEPQAAGVPRIEVTFTVDANGILNVAAKDAKSGRLQEIDVRPSSGLSITQIQEMLAVGREMESADFEARLLAEARADGERVARLTRKLIREDAGEASAAAEHAAAQTALASLDEALRCNSHRSIRDAMERVDLAAHPVAQRLMDRNIHGYLTGKSVADV